MQSETKIRRELYSKLEKEYNLFVENLKKSSAENIIDKSYEKVMKEELCEMFYPEYERYDIEQIKALNKAEKPLQELYEGWKNSDEGIYHLLEDCTWNMLEGLVQEQRQKNKLMER